MAWLVRIFTEWKSNDTSVEKVSEIIQTFKVKLTYFMYENFAQSVISQFFSIIIGKFTFYINTYNYCFKLGDVFVKYD